MASKKRGPKRAPQSNSMLSSQYRAVGPAAIVAALLFVPKTKTSFGKPA